MEKWEYKILQILQSSASLMSQESKLNELGKEGWELVQWDLRDGVYRFYMKRRKG